MHVCSSLHIVKFCNVYSSIFIIFSVVLFTFLTQLFFCMCFSNCSASSLAPFTNSTHTSMHTRSHTRTLCATLPAVWWARGLISSGQLLSRWQPEHQLPAGEGGLVCGVGMGRDYSLYVIPGENGRTHKKSIVNGMLWCDCFSHWSTNTANSVLLGYQEWLCFTGWVLWNQFWKWCASHLLWHSLVVLD